MKIQKPILLLMAAAALASCGGGNQPTSSETSTGTSSEATSSLMPSSESSSQAPQKFLITFNDEEGNLLESKLWEEGVIPSYRYEKTDTDEWDYIVQGWSLTLGGDLIEIPAVSAAATYYAKVTKAKRKYTITFDSKGGSEVSSVEVEYGTSVDEPDDPNRDGYKFVAWSYDEAGTNEVEWPVTVTKDLTVYANWNEVVDIKAYLKALTGALKQSPYGFIPDTMKPENSANHVTPSQIVYDFTNFTSVSSIKYGGFGEQWNMVIDNIRESERFYSVVTLGEAIINASVALFNNYLDSNPGDTASHTLKETEYTAKLDFSEGVLSYTIQYKTGLNIPLFGEVLPQIDLVYDVEKEERTARIQLTENNAMRYVITNNSYVMALQYGVSLLSRKAYLEINKDEEGAIDGHIYEFVQLKDKDLVPSCADFYIDEDYVSVVGNKASGIPGFTGYINELYKTSAGKLLGYEIRETINKWGVTATYHTLWFNLNDINGINNVKAIKNEESTYGLGGNNNHDIYLNNSAKIFEPTYNTKLLVKTSRKYDVELRKQYFYGQQENKLVQYETEIPMMFIQADHDGYTNFTDFPKDILSKSGIQASVGLSSTYLDKIQADYATLIDLFIAHKEAINSDAIKTFIGSPAIIG